MRPSAISLSGMCALGLACLMLPLAVAAPGAQKTRPAPKPRVDFDRDVRPILSENCFTCHGPDSGKRQAGLRLDTPEGPYARLSDGNRAVVPGDPDNSMLAVRVSATVDLVKMPPPASDKKLTPAQIATLMQWIKEGARYAPHWSFIPPKRPTPPGPPFAREGDSHAPPFAREGDSHAPPLAKGGIQGGWLWCRNPIDRFVLARLEQEGLRPSPEADRRTLLRRVALDLTGLPPTPVEVDAFLADKRPDAYERVVDRLLASPRYGERMALHWLDLARYADTHGYHIDSQRDMWPWRDWVIRAFNNNLPYDKFIIWQLAGDLLPNATTEQKIATGFNRNHPINFEGGAIPEEYAAAYIADRIDTTSTAFMGLTMRCAQCHDHKYDPITQKEYYRFYAFFNNVPEQGLDGQKGNAAPFMKAMTPEQQAQLEAYGRKVAEMDQAMKARAAEAAPTEAAWEKSAFAALDKEPPVSGGLAAYCPLDETSGDKAGDAAGKQAGKVVGKASWAKGKAGGALTFDGSTYVDLGSGGNFERTDKFSYGAWVYPTSNEALTVVSRMDDADNFRGWDMFMIEGKVYVHLIHRWEQNAIRVNTKNPVPLNQWHHVFVTYDGSSKAKGVKVYVDGKPAELDVTHDSLSDSIRAAKPLLIGRRNPAAPFKGMLDEVRVYSRELSPAEVAQLAGFDAIRQILATPAEKRTKEQQDALARYYLENRDEPYQKLLAEADGWRRKQADLDAAIPTVMVMQEMDKPRDTFLLARGQYDQPGEKVTPGTPACLPPMPKDAPVNRLGLALWLVDPSHPLTARVAVNHFWQMFFGTGLVRTAENFGTQGERPSHPELLDWLATEFVRTGWDVKRMQKLIVTSATYRQSSRVTPDLLAKDPENRLLARGPRFRLPAEFIRDQALNLSGLLVEKVGGPSVKPYQPAGLWEEISFKGGFTAQFYEQDHGDALYRRSMYTFWKRTCPPPALQTFDAPSREFCVVNRGATNTPLQALVLMNDPTYVEASRKFAERLMTEGGSTPRDRLRYAYRLALCRLPRAAERDVLLDIYDKQLARFQKDPDAAKKLLSVGESKRSEKLDAAELAAWTTVAGVITNLDETITKE
jgi:hypothetical protein